MLQFHYWALFCFAFFAACGNTPEQAKIEIIGGIEYVHNPAAPLHPEKSVTFIEELAIGGEDASGEIQLYQPRRFTVDTKGNIYIYDRAESKIKVFDSNGAYILPIGKKGSGPGEFQGIHRMKALPDGRLFVMDVLNRRTSLFSTTGEYLESYQWDTPLFDVYLVTDSTYVADAVKYKSADESLKEIKSFDFAGHELFSYGRFTETKRNFTSLGNGMWSVMSLPFAPGSIFAGDDQRQYLYHCFNAEYMIEVYDQQGTLFRKIDRPYEPLPFTDKDANAYLTGFSDENARRLAKEVEFPEIKTVAEYLCVDEQGKLWVETNEKKEKDHITFTAYDIFDENGIYYAKVWSPVRTDIFSNGKMYSLVVDDETGFRSVKRYRVVWND